MNRLISFTEGMFAVCDAWSDVLTGSCQLAKKMERIAKMATSMLEQ